MKVKFATQVFSRSVEAAIKTALATGQFTTCSQELALSTAKFVGKIDKIFDCMNSGSLYADNRYRVALQKGSASHSYIKEFLIYLDGISLATKGRQFYFLQGIKTSLNAILQLTDDLFASNSRVSFVLTKSLNLDRLENTFSLFRQQRGLNKMPSAANVNNIIAKIMCCKFIQLTSSSNCESTGQDEDVLAKIYRLIQHH